MGTDIVWEDPPGKGYSDDGTHTDWGPIMEQLKSSPGQWARIRERSTSQASRSTARYLRTANPEFRFISRTVYDKVEDKKYFYVYGRYVGEEKKHG